MVDAQLLSMLCKVCQMRPEVLHVQAVLERPRNGIM